MRLAAAVPQFTWTDLLQSLAPERPDRHDSPFGIGKFSIVNGLVASAGSKVPPKVLGWIARLNAGEPYDSPSDPVVPEAKRRAHGGPLRRSTRTTSSARCAGAASGRSPCWPRRAGPTRSSRRPRACGCTQRLRAARRRYPVRLYLGDFEHLTAAVKIPDFAYYHRLGNRMLDRYLRGRGKRPRFDVRSARTRCEKDRFGPVTRARRWRTLGPRG